jgi:hypothetical protein
MYTYLGFRFYEAIQGPMLKFLKHFRQKFMH